MTDANEAPFVIANWQARGCPGCGRVVHFLPGQEANTCSWCSTVVSIETAPANVPQSCPVCGEVYAALMAHLTANAQGCAAALLNDDTPREP